jgi:predicted dehydrogenase
MTIVGTRKMIVYNDIEPMEKIRIYDTRIERPAHYDSFGEFHYSYHYGDSFIPYINQNEPLRKMCQHFINGILSGVPPLSSGKNGLEVLRILEASSKSLRANGAAIMVADPLVDYPALAAVDAYSDGVNENHNGSYAKSVL